jgi:phosphohistidine phosphatase
MQLVIMRHGEAEGFAGSDEQRNLTDFGRQQATAAGLRLKQLGMTFDQVWVSPFTRTQQTAGQVLPSLPTIERQTLDILVPDSNPATVIEQLESSSAQSLLLISHQPLVSNLTALLETGSWRGGPAMAPASMVLLEAEQLLSGCCQRRWLRHSPDFVVGC